VHEKSVGQRVAVIVGFIYYFSCSLPIRLSGRKATNKLND